MKVILEVEVKGDKNGIIEELQDEMREFAFKPKWEDNANGKYQSKFSRLTLDGEEITFEK